MPAERGLKAPLEPYYFEALTDNDIDFLNFTPFLIPFHPFYKWKRASKKAKAIKTVVTNGDDNSIEVHIAWKTPGTKNSVSTYRIYPTEEFMFITVLFQRLI